MMMTTANNLDSTQTTLVSHENKWIPISWIAPPFGAKCLLIDKEQGIAYVRQYKPEDGWTHWHPLPTFKKE